MPGNELVQSLVRGLAVLEQVAGAAEGATLQELARALAVQPSTAHNLARTLVARGYLEKCGRPPCYRLGPALFELVRASRGQALRARAEAAVRALAAALPGATVTLCEAVGGEVVPVLRIGRERPDVLQTPFGPPMSPYHSATTLVFQAFWTAEEREIYRRRYPFDEYGAHAWPSPAALEAELDAIRRQGGVVRPPDASTPLLRAAVPVFDAGGVLHAALGVAVPAGDAEAVTHALRLAQRSIAPEERLD